MIEILYLEITAARHLLEPLIERLNVPIVAGHLRRDPFENVRLYRIFDDLRDAFGEVLALKDRIALVVDSFALQRRRIRGRSYVQRSSPIRPGAERSRSLLKP